MRLTLWEDRRKRLKISQLIIIHANIKQAAHLRDRRRDGVKITYPAFLPNFFLNFEFGQDVLQSILTAA